MLTSKTELLKPLIESSSGVHLTAYIRNLGSVPELKAQLENVIETAESYLRPIMNEEESEKFLAPIQLILDDNKRMKRLPKNFGIFRTTHSFRVLNLPIDVENSCDIADTFHVKPLLKWLQFEREFLILGLDESSATLYQGSMDSFKQIDSVLFPDSVQNDLQAKPGSKSLSSVAQQSRIDETMEWLNGWIMTLTNEVRPRLFLAGNKKLVRSLLKVLQYENTETDLIWSSFSHKSVPSICTEIRAVLKSETRKSFERSLVEFHYANDLRVAKANVFTIAKAAVEGRIRKLLISDGIKIFGKLDRKTGELALHSKDLNHEDDDILDDLAQTVLARGGEVVVASRGEIPRGRPVLAIMDESHSIEMPQVHFVETRSHTYQEPSSERSAV